MKISFLLPLVFAFTFFYKQPNTESKILRGGVPKVYLGDTLGFTMVKNHIVVDAVIFDSLKVKLLFDTGADGLYIDSAFAKQHNLTQGNLVGNGSAGRLQYLQSLAALKSKLAAVKVNHTEASLRPAIVDLKGTTIDYVVAFLGLNFMDKYVMEVNYKQKFIVFHNPAEFKPNSKLPQIQMTRAKFNRYFLSPEFDVANNLKIKGEAYLDLGYGPGNIGMGSLMVTKYNLMGVLKDKKIENVKGKFLSNEKVTYYSASIRSATIGDITIDTPKIRLMQSTGKGNSNTSVSFIGNYVFSRFTTVFFDFPNNKIYLDK